MDNLIKQMWLKSSSIEQEKRESNNTKDRRIPLQNTQSFKGDKKRNWISRQFSGQMNQQKNNTYGIEYATAVAAAASVIQSLEDSRIQAKKKANGDPNTSIKTKSKAEDRTTQVQVPRALSRKSSDVVPERRVSFSAATDENIPSKGIGQAPSIKKTPTFADNNLNNNSTTKPASTLSYPYIPSMKPSTFPTTELKRQSSTKPGGAENTKADIWEKAEMAKIKEWYEKVNNTIFNWEKKKKIKAKRRMDKIQGELDRKRAKTLQHYSNKMSTIDQIAGGARSQAEQNRRNKEAQVKEKANRIRATGKFPATCFCF